jgi:ribonuclease HI
MARAYTDGACRGGNPGICSCAFVVEIGGSYYDHSVFLGPGTNNYAEYQGLLSLLRWAHEEGAKKLDIFSDSQLVVNQVNGLWNVNKSEIEGMCNMARHYMSEAGHRLHYIRGHAGHPGNERADKLCNQVLDMWESKHGKEK